MHGRMSMGVGDCLERPPVVYIVITALWRPIEGAAALACFPGRSKRVRGESTRRSSYQSSEGWSMAQFPLRALSRLWLWPHRMPALLRLRRRLACSSPPHGMAAQRLLISRREGD